MCEKHFKYLNSQSGLWRLRFVIYSMERQAFYEEDDYQIRYSFRGCYHIAEFCPCVFPLTVPFWFAFGFVFFLVYYFNKNAYTYFITDKSVRIEKSWFFGSYVREITFDQIRDVHIMQGILARMFNCGSLVFITSTGLEVGYVGGGAAVGRGVIVGSDVASNYASPATFIRNYCGST